MAQAKALMIQGTGSHVGKSLLVAAFCRILSNQGLRVAPFKAQNMSLNAFVTADGAEVSRAQALQAEAARMPVQAEMNPVLLKPTSETGSQVIVLGRAVGTMAAKAYHQYKEELWPVVEAAYRRLAAQVDVVVIEGAGSPAEINLKAHDIVNMRVAALAGAPVLLVGDIDRGGVFAALLGTLEWLEPEERQRVAGFLINKFRGDGSLLGPGLEALARRTGVPVLGVIPYIPDLRLDEEDSVALDDRCRPNGGESGRLAIGVPRLPRLSNFTDLDPLEAEPEVAVRFVTAPDELAACRVAILPGSKNTMEDLAWLRRQGLDRAIRRLAGEGGWVIGICGGYQMLGRRIDDPYGMETTGGEAEGLGLLPVDTVLERVKQTLPIRCEPAGPWVCATHADQLGELSGYEIHLGRTTRASDCAPAFLVRARSGTVAGSASSEDGARSPDGRVWGTYAHGLFENDRFRQCLLSRWLDRPCPDEPGPSYAMRRGQGLQKLAEVVAGAVDLRAVARLLGL
ncbi:cobyric acid synthase [Nitrospira sp. Kam-Ns4a]